MHTRRAAIMFALTLLASVAVAAGTGTPALGQSGTRMTEPPHSGSLDGDEGSLAFQVDMEAGIAGYLATSAGDLRRPDLCRQVVSVHAL